MHDPIAVELQASGRVTTAQLSSWAEVASLCAVLDAIGREGSSAVLKIDGAREGGCVYTVVISGGRLGEAFFRKDGGDLRALLREAIDFYRTHVWALET